MSATTCFYNKREISLFYSLYPILDSPYWNRFHYTTSLEWVLKKDKNKRILIVGAFLYILEKQGAEYVTDCLKQIRAKYDYVAFWDDNAGSGMDFGMVLPYVDAYFKKHIMKDKSFYARPVMGTLPFGATLFGEYYYQNFMNQRSLQFTPVVHVSNSEDLKKVKPIWNLGWGSYPLLDNRSLIGVTAAAVKTHPIVSKIIHKDPLKHKVDLSRKEKLCSFRYTRGIYDPSIGFQRDYMTGLLEKNGFKGFERIDRKACYEELERASVSFSPFGWGEVCFRDFESILFGSVLVKPDCSHFETYPNIYVAGETYLPVRWDGSDLAETIENALNDQALQKRLIGNALGIYLESFLSMPQKVKDLVEEVLG